ncbi:NADH dehydrogenase [ubiquinone] 1 alpha subcomplex subunit 11-like [Artemia franciscana]|uniref:NADH dehydrogenase [ubiquinone] 1 alpha subcomplex subunit 11-like n=1 Tax=Artemia franciscana TaxID=6661 RepID=UPI0032DA9165
MFLQLKNIFNYEPLKYQYYDTPEGEDCDKKLLYLVSRGAYVGFAGSLYVALLNKHIKGIPNHLFYIAKWTVPVVGIAAAYGIGTCISTSLRRKDDYWNNAIGAGISASLIGTLGKSFRFGYMSFLLILGGVIMKRKSVEYNYMGGKILCDPSPVGNDRLFFYGNHPSQYDFSFAHKGLEGKKE